VSKLHIASMIIEAEFHA